VLTVMIVLGTGVALAGAPATQPACRPSVGPMEMAPGWQFKVRRLALVDGQIVAGGKQKFPLKFTRDVRFDEEVKKVADGRAAEIVRTVIDSVSKQTDPETGKQTTSQLAKKGDAFRVVFTGLDSTITGVKEGQAVSEGIREALPDRLTHDLLPAGPLKKGQSWSFKGDEVTKRFQAISLEGGQIDLKVTDISPDKDTGVMFVEIKGKLKSQIDFDITKATFEADITMTMPLRVGVPTVEINGTLSAQGTAKNDDGEPFTYVLKAKAAYVQAVIPSPKLMEATK